MQKLWRIDVLKIRNHCFGSLYCTQSSMYRVGNKPLTAKSLFLIPPTMTQLKSKESNGLSPASRIKSDKQKIKGMELSVSGKMAKITFCKELMQLLPYSTYSLSSSRLDTSRSLYSRTN